MSHEVSSSGLQPDHFQRITEIFRTPLVGAYTWNYRSTSAKLARLYELGKRLNWNASVDIDWARPVHRDAPAFQEGANGFVGYHRYEALDLEGKLAFEWHSLAWIMSQFLHGEQGALLVASQLVSAAPTYDAKLYAAEQTFDEARHVEAFSRYISERIGITYGPNPLLKALLDKILTDVRWDLKFIGMQMVVEGLALAAFQTLRYAVRDTLFSDLIAYVIRDEARHVAYGMTFLEEFVAQLAPDEREERAAFAYEACRVMRDRMVQTEVFERFGWDVREATYHAVNTPMMVVFQSSLFARVIPNLAKVGLLTARTRPLYEELGVLQFENGAHDADINWVALESTRS
jgi:hypothetical protein